MNTDVFVFRMVGGLIYTGEVTGESESTIFLVDERVGRVELNKCHVVAQEKRVNKTIKRIDNSG